MKKEPLLSFHGSEAIKAAKIADIMEHRRLDNLKQGSYWDGKKGCAVTCTMFTPEDFKNGNVDDSGIHARFETQLGIPRILARLEDRMFEGLTVNESKDWPLNFMEAIPVGVNLEPVWRKFMIWLLVDAAEGVVKFVKDEAGRQAIQNIADAFTKSLTATVTSDEWWTLRSAVRSAYAAYAAAAAYAAYAAAAAAAAYAYADASADAAYADASDAAAYAADAYAAYASAAAYAASDADARKHRYTAMAAKLIELLKEAA